MAKLCLKNLVNFYITSKKQHLSTRMQFTCSIQFNKLVNVLLNTLKSPKFSPFEKYHVIHYFKRIEFQHRGSPHAHILLWLANAPVDALDNNKLDAIALINSLISVPSQQASSNIKL